MRKGLLVLLCLSLKVSAQNIKLSKPKVDPRVELLSIVFRLADSEEYNSNENSFYVEKVHKHFDSYKNHELIRYVKQIRESYGISYDAVMAYAVSLDSLPTIKPLVSFSQSLPDKRWNEVTLTRFTELLKQFYLDTDCRSFFRSNMDYYAAAEKQFYSLFKKLDVDWYYKYYGKLPNENFKIIIGLGNGRGNYGPHIDLADKSRDVYAIIGASTFDSTGAPTFEADYYLPTLIHEFNHSFVNYLLEKYETQLKHSGEVILDKERAKMKRQKYSYWQTVINEATVRASVIRYLMNHESDTTKIDSELKRELANGFVWMKELVDLLGQYENKRKSYPTLENFMPEIVSFYNTVASNIDTYESNYLKNCAKVVSVKPVENETISSNTTEIIFQFDKRLDGIRYFFGPGPKGIEHYPKPIDFKFTNNNMTIVMRVKLEPNKDYQVNMIGRMMRTHDRYNVQDFVLNFKTKE